jgi:histidine triad (HIT) family protein
MTEETIFSKIIRGELPCEKIYEDEHTFSFLDIAPNNLGHTLVIPKEHYVNILDVPEDVLTNVIKTVKKVSNAVKEGIESEGIYLAVNNVVGQEVPHLHFHVVPRNEGDGWAHGRHLKYEDGQMKEIGDKIRKFI